MQRKPIIDSSNIKSIGYDPVTQILEVEFIKGGLYQYKDVPKVEGEAFRDRPDGGSYGDHFQNKIKGVYSYRKVN